MLDHKWKWQDDGFINEQPLREATGVLVNRGKTCYFLVGLLQLLIMAAFTNEYIPDWFHCISGSCDLNATSFWLDLNATKRTEQTGYPSWLWLIWPCILLIYNGYMYVGPILSKIGLRDVWSKHCWRQQDPSSNKKEKDPVPTSLDLRLATIDRLPPLGFAVAMFIWFHAYRSWDDNDYHQATAVVFLFGWITGLMLVGDTFTWTHKFAKMLKEIMAKDVLLAGTATFPYILFAFSSAAYALRGLSNNSTVPDTPEINLYKVLTSGLTQDIDDSGERGKGGAAVRSVTH